MKEKNYVKPGVQDINLSGQAMGAIMMALQKSLMDQSDIVPVLEAFRFRLSDDGLVVMNPPTVKFDPGSAVEDA